MSQHLINDFMQRYLVFKPVNGEKLVNKRLQKYQASNRQNNSSPEDVEESIHYLKPIKPVETKKQENKEDDDKHIDVTV